MIKLEVIEPFTLERFGELKNIERVGLEKPGKLNVGDKFECEKELADYLLGDNPIKRSVVKVIEIIPEKETNTADISIKDHIEKSKKRKSKK